MRRGKSEHETDRQVGRRRRTTANPYGSKPFEGYLKLKAARERQFVVISCIGVVALVALLAALLDP